MNIYIAVLCYSYVTLGLPIWLAFIIQIIFTNIIDKLEKRRV